MGEGKFSEVCKSFEVFLFSRIVLPMKRKPC